MYSFCYSILFLLERLRVKNIEIVLSVDMFLNWVFYDYLIYDLYIKA